MIRRRCPARTRYAARMARLTTWRRPSAGRWRSKTTTAIGPDRLSPRKGTWRPLEPKTAYILPILPPAPHATGKGRPRTCRQRDLIGLRGPPGWPESATAGVYRRFPAGFGVLCRQSPALGTGPRPGSTPTRPPTRPARDAAGQTWRRPGTDRIGRPAGGHADPPGGGLQSLNASAANVRRFAISGDPAGTGRGLASRPEKAKQADGRRLLRAIFPKRCSGSTLPGRLQIVPRVCSGSAPRYSSRPSSLITY